MKKLLPLILFPLFFWSGLKSQNTYDTYNTGCGVYPAYDPVDGTPIDAIPSSGYFGEYQIFLNEHPWDVAPALNTNAISYKIETVSFPFTPNCIHCQSYFPATPDRHLRMPNDQFPYIAAQKAWVRNTSSLIPPGPTSTQTNDYLLRREFSGSYGVPLSGVSEGNTHFATLASRGIAQDIGSPIEFHSKRVFYPHSILKHTFYMHCGSGFTDAIVDSIVFVIDHTRGRMRYYPFMGSNTNTNESEHDVIVSLTWAPLIASEPTYLNTINYYPIPVQPSVCQDHIPTDGSLTWSPDNYIRPEPGTLLQYFLGNFEGQTAAGYIDETTPAPGIMHKYIIDRPVDLTLLNPSEKIIYNPSETEIDLNTSFNTTGINTLTFPTGYVFKTIGGIYPTVTQVYNSDPDGLYNDPRDIPVPTTLSCDDVAANDGVFSYYYVKSGSTLNIEPCVGIYDAEIVVESGGTLIYDPQQTYGNYTIVQDPGSTVNVVNLPQVVGCAHDCYDIYNYDVKDILISADETWVGVSPYDNNGDGVIRIAGRMRILANKTLTITGGLHFEFGENADIVVEKGAKLIINSHPSNFSTMTSASICKKGMWMGIRVLGDGTLSQNTANQGQVKLTNVRISNARDAITSGNGGIIQCSFVEFKNNRRSVGFGTYHNKPFPAATFEYNNVSYLKNCSFFTTGYLNDPVYQTADGRRYQHSQVSMWDVKNVAIESCVFENSAIKTDGTPLFDTDLRGSGIFAIDAGIQLREFAPNTFKGYSDGVRMISTGETDLVWIQGTVFKNNVHGLTLEATPSPIINLNTFEIPVHEANLYLSDVSLGKGYKKPVGLYLIGTTDFTAQENIFTNYGPIASSSLPTQEYNYGMVVNNCTGSTADGLGYSYKNKFSNLNVNLQSELDNKGGFDPLSTTPSSEGLEYKCNEFITRINRDVTVPDGPGIASLIRDQGLCVAIDPQKQAGNTYIACTPPSSDQLEFGLSSLSANSDFIYRDHSSTVPSCSNNTIFTCIGTSSAPNCPTNFSLCATIPCLTTYYEDALLAADLSSASYLQLLDGGSTSFLLGEINSSLPPAQLKNLLISKSPYLSDQVLIATLNRSDLPPYGHLEQIFIANSPVTRPVITAIQNAGLPSGIINNIMAAQTGISARAEKESEVNYYAFQANLAKVNLKQGYFKIDNIDSLKIVAEKDTTMAGLIKLIGILISEGSYTDAQACLALIHTKEGGTHTDQCRINGIRLNLAMNNKTWYDMSAGQSAAILQIYQNNPLTAIEARSILALTKDLQYERYPFDGQTARTMSESDQEIIQAATLLSGFKVYPNPSTEQANVDIDLENETLKAELVIYNMLGAEISRYNVIDQDVLKINTKEFNTGIYLFVLKTENAILEKQKVIVSR